MNHANGKDFESVKEIFHQHKNWFPHVRDDYIRRMIAKSNLIFENDVVIAYTVYKRKQTIGDVIAERGDCILYQIAARCRNGSASKTLQRFFEFTSPRRVFLSVRSENEIAKKFYLKNGMELVGSTSWSNGTLPGDVYLHQPSKHRLPYCSAMPETDGLRHQLQK